MTPVGSRNVVSAVPAGVEERATEQQPGPEYDAPQQHGDRVPQGPRSPAVRRLGVVLLAVLAGFGLRLLLSPLLGPASPFILFIPAVLVAAWYGGLWPGLFATLLSSILAIRYFLSPLPGWTIETWDRLGLFLVVCIAITWVQVRVEAASRRVRASLAAERDARREAQAANRAKDDFLAMVSHELRSPANVVRGWTSLLRSGRLDAASVAKGLEVIERNVTLQGRLIEDIVDSMRVAKGTMRLRRQPIDLASVVTAAVDAARPSAAAQGIDLQQTVDVVEAPVFGDPERLQQVMTNLLSNALKFTPSGGSVTVEMRRAASQVRVSVRDTGIGIDPAFLPFVFERFARGNHAREGLGLGMAITRHLVEMHGGRIEVASAGPERGTVFTVTLPLSEDSGSGDLCRTGNQSPNP
jgi:signal transduction histidine kinase